MAVSVEAVEEELTCKICICIFKEPKTLSCMHSFCEKCLQKHIRTDKSAASSKDTFGCPVCREIIKPRDRTKPKGEWAKDFVTDFKLKNMLKPDKETESEEGQLTGVLKKRREHLKKYSDPLMKAKQSLMKDIDTDEKRCDRLIESKKQAKEAIKMTTLKLIEEIRSKEKTCLEDLDALFDQERNRITEDKRIRKEVFNSVETQLDWIDKLGSSVTSVTSELRKVKETQETILNSVKNLPHVPPQSKVCFSPHCEANRRITESLKIGKLEISNIDEVNKPSLEASNLVDPIGNERDVSLSNILVMTVDGERKIFVTDSNNKCIKSFSCFSGSWQSERFPLPCSPTGIVRYDKNHIAVASLSCIFIICVSPAFKMVRRLCDGTKNMQSLVSLGDETLAVGKYGEPNGCIELINRQGEVLRTFTSFVADKDFKNPWYLAATPKDEILVSDRHQKVLVCMNKSGKTLWCKTLSYQPSGVTWHRSGSIFLATERKAIERRAANGEYLQEILTEDDQLSNPLGTCCDDNRMYTLDNYNKILVFSLTGV